MATSTLSVTQFEAAFHADYKKTTGFVASRGLSQDAAEDIAQAAWARAWERRHQLREVSAMGAWVNKIALNLVRTAARQAKRTVGLDSAPEPTCRVDLSGLEANRILSRCRSRDRTLLRRHYLDDKSVEELAQELGVNAATVRVRLFRTRRAVQSLLRLHGDEMSRGQAAMGMRRRAA